MRERDFCNVCKRLSNAERWSVLRQVAISADGFGSKVGDISANTHLGVSATSQYLSQLEDECGLVASRREGRYVCYEFVQDREDSRAVELGAALRKHFCGGDGHEVLILPALANEARVGVVAALRKVGRATKAELQKMTGLTEINVRRHLGVMINVGLAEQSGQGFSFVEPRDELARLFLGLSLK